MRDSYLRATRGIGFVGRHFMALCVLLLAAIALAASGA